MSGAGASARRFRLPSRGSPLGHVADDSSMPAAASPQVGGVVIVIDAKNERVAGWYASYGAVPLLDAPLTLLLLLATIEAALRAAGQY